MLDPRVVAAAVLALCVCMVGTAGGAAPDQSLVPVGTAHQVTPAAHNVTEFQVARSPRDPRHLAVGAIDLDKPGAHAGCMAYLSEDGGATWRPSNPLSRLPSGDRALSADPMLAFDKRGRLHMICLLPGSDFTTMQGGLRNAYIRSDDFGQTWTAPVDVPTIDSTSAPDKPALYVADGRLVVCATQGVDKSPENPFGRSTIGIAVSEDDGASWRVFEPPTLVGYDGTCNALTRDGKGALHMQFESLGGEKAGPGTLATVSSPDGGLTWGAPAVYASDTYMQNAPPGTAWPFASMAEADPTRTTVYATGTGATADGRWHLILAKSVDGGRSFLPMAPPAPPSPACRRHMRNPVVHVDQRGRVALEFQCRDDLEVEAGHREVWLTASVDGRTWLAPQLLVREPAPQCTTPYVVGQVNQVDTCWRFADGADYWFITSGPRGFHAFWIDATAGYSAIRMQVFDIRRQPTQRPQDAPPSAQAESSGAAAGQLPATGYGAALSLLGLLLLTAGLRLRRRRPPAALH